MISTRQTIADCIARTPRPSGFDYVRIVLALLVVADHSVLACLGDAGQRAMFSGYTRPVMVALVPTWFALSGYLVASSLIRTDLKTFICLRTLRIFPALAVDTLFTAFLLGAWLTTVPLSTYFTSPIFFKYLLNMFDIIHYKLPGVFEQNPITLVNVQLWTLPLEVKCYIVLAVLAFFGLHRRRSVMLLTNAAVVIGTAIYASYVPPGVVDTWHLLGPCFLTSVIIYLYRDVIPWHSGLALGSAVAVAALLSTTHSVSVFAAVPLSYLTIWLGYLNPKRDPLVRSGDYSYPLYLYSFPIQQALIVLFSWASVWWLNLLAAIPISFVLAALSWHYVEKPIGGLRQHIDKLSFKSAIALISSVPKLRFTEK